MLPEITRMLICQAQAFIQRSRHLGLQFDTFIVFSFDDPASRFGIANEVSSAKRNARYDGLAIEKRHERQEAPPWFWVLAYLVVSGTGLLKRQDVEFL